MFKTSFFHFQIEARDREIDRLTVLLSTEGRPVKALAEDCCYRNVKQLHEDVDHLQRENTRLKSRLACCTKSTLFSKEARPGKMENECICGQPKATKPIETPMNACKLSAKSCDEVRRQVDEKDKTIKNLWNDLDKYKGDDSVLLMTELNEKLGDRLKLQDVYKEKLSEHQKVLKRATSLGRKDQENCENEPIRPRKNAGMEVELSKLQNEIDCMRQDLEQLSVFNQRQDCLQDLKKQLTVKECEINTLKNRSCLSASSANRCESDRSWMGGMDSCRGSVDRVCMDREHCRMAEELERLTADRYTLEFKLNNEIKRFRMEREAYNNTLDRMKCRLEMVERDNRELLAKQQPKNEAITCMQSEMKALRHQIEVLRTDNESLQVCKSANFLPSDDLL